MENEIWKTIEEFPMYEVSNLGRIQNTTSKKMGHSAMGGPFFIVRSTQQLGDWYGTNASVR